jgi:hypothetical protein
MDFGHGLSTIPCDAHNSGFSMGLDWDGLGPAGDS